MEKQLSEIVNSTTFCIKLPLYVNINKFIITYQFVHFWTNRAFRPIRQFSDENQPIWYRFLNKKVPDTSHCFFIHFVQIRPIIFSMLKPNFNKVLIVAVPTRSKSNIFSTELTRVRTADIRKKHLFITILKPHEWILALRNYG